MSTSSTLKAGPSGDFHTLPGLKPLLARMIGLQPAQTLIAKRTVRSAIGL
jgi:SAM-dependent MidA family methyltransferase